VCYEQVCGIKRYERTTSSKNNRIENRAEEIGRNTQTALALRGFRKKILKVSTERKNKFKMTF
jgi:hypothetical protein